MFDFYAMTWLEWCYYSNGLYKSKIKEWEHTRALAWLIYKANADPKKAASTMQTWWPLSTDSNFNKKQKKVRRKKLTPIQVQEFFKSMR